MNGGNKSAMTKENLFILERKLERLFRKQSMNTLHRKTDIDISMTEIVPPSAPRNSPVDSEKKIKVKKKKK